MYVCIYEKRIRRKLTKILVVVAMESVVSRLLRFFWLVCILGNKRIKGSEIFCLFFVQKIFHPSDRQLYLLNLLGYVFINI